jgi:hypothetical protein
LTSENQGRWVLWVALAFVVAVVAVVLRLAHRFRWWPWSPR